jgi:hypothetical protein
MNITQSISSAVKRVFAPSATKPGESFGDAIGGLGFGGLGFTSISEFIDFYKSDAFKVAYFYMDPLSCYNLATASPLVMSAIGAITRPITSAEIIGMQKRKHDENLDEINTLNELMEEPNPNQDAEEFKDQALKCGLITGNIYYEVADNAFGYPASIYIHEPYNMKQPSPGVYEHRDGTKFKPGSIIHRKCWNPLSEYVGMSPLVPIVTAMMLDSTIVKNNLGYYDSNQLKGILNVDSSVPYSEAKDEFDRIGSSIKQMKKEGKEGHLIAYATTFQAITSNNKEMMTPDMMEELVKRIGGTYGVPPAKVMRIDSGNIGGGTGESQADTMNETNEFWANYLLVSPLKRYLVNAYDFKDTTLGITNLTKKDDLNLAKLNTEYMKNYSTTINEIRKSRGEERIDSEYADEPLVPQQYVPLSMMGQTPMTANPNGANPNDTKPINPADDSDEAVNENLMAVLREVGVKDFKVVRSA